MNKKIICQALLLTISSSVLFGCDGESSSSSSSLYPQQQYKMTEVNGQMVVGNVNDLDGVWFGVGAKDGLSNETNGKIGFVYDNSTLEDAKLLGCMHVSGANHLENHLKDIPAGASVRMKALDDPRMRRIAEGNNGLVMRSFEEQESAGVAGYLQENGTNEETNAQDVCYYKVPISDTGKSVYFGLEIKADRAGTYSAVFQPEPNKPSDEVKQILASAQLDNVLFSNGMVSTLTGIPAIIVNQNMMTRQRYLDRYMAMLEKWQTEQMSEINKLLNIINNTAGKFSAAEVDAAKNKLADSMINGAQGEIGHANASVKSKEELLKYLDEYKASEIKWISRPDKNYVGGEKTLSIFVDKDGVPLPYQRGFETSDRYFVEAPTKNNLSSLSIKQKKFYDAMLKDSTFDVTKISDVAYTAEKATEYGDEAASLDGPLNMTSGIERRLAKKPLMTSFQEKLLDQEMRASGLTFDFTQFAIEDNMIEQGGKLIARDLTSETEARLASRIFTAAQVAVASTGVGLLTEAVNWFVTAPLFSKLFSSVGGQFTTTVVRGQLFVPNSQQIADWNTKNPNAQMEDTTKVVEDTSQVKGDPKLASSIHQTLKVALKSPGNGDIYDQQSGISISMQAISTEFLRALTDKDVEDAKSNNYNDPYLNVKPLNISSLLRLSISAPSSEITDNDGVQFETDVLKEAGMSAFAPVVLDAPTVNSTQAYKLPGSSKVGYRIGNVASLQSSNNLLSSVSGLKLTTVGNLQGLFLSPGQLVKLNVSVPTVSGYPDIKEGTSLQTVFIDTTDSDSESSAVFSKTKSANLFNKFSSSGLPTYLSSFSCQAPYTLGQGCDLYLGVSSNGTSGKQDGKLYIFDANGKSLAIPTYMNYSLVTEPRSVTTEQGSGDTNTLTLANVSGSNYKSIKIDGLPSGAKIKSSTCDAGLAANSQCKIVYDFSDLEPDTYKLTITGVSSNRDAVDADIGGLSVSVTPSW